MARRHGYALLGAIIALIVILSAAIYVTVASDGGAATRERTSAEPGSGRGPVAPASTGIWVGAWSASPAGAEPGTELRGLAGNSVRNVVHTGVGGRSARVTLSNLYGQSPLTITHATLALAAGPATAAAAPGSMRPLTFGGRPSVVIPPGRQVLSDAVRLAIPAEADVLVTTYSPTPSGPVTFHPHARQTSYLAEGDVTEDLTGTAYTRQADAWRYLTALDVLSNDSDGTVVVFGDSLTDGISSSRNANRRWTDVLARRLRTAIAAGEDVPRYSIVNQGISGNQILASGAGRPADNEAGIGRFQRDVLSRTSVKAVVIDLGVNDILRNPHLTGPDTILDGLRSLVSQAHARGLKVVGATLMPFQGHRGYTVAREEIRQQINAEIRAGHVFDAVTDFDAAVRDPYNPRGLLPEYDSGDHLHPNDRGYEHMAQSFNLQDLKGTPPAKL